MLLRKRTDFYRIRVRSVRICRTEISSGISGSTLERNLDWGSGDWGSSPSSVLGVWVRSVKSAQLPHSRCSHVKWNRLGDLQSLTEKYEFVFLYFTVVFSVLSLTVVGLKTILFFTSQLWLIFVSYFSWISPCSALFSLNWIPWNPKSRRLGRRWSCMTSKAQQAWHSYLAWPGDLPFLPGDLWGSFSCIFLPFLTLCKVTATSLHFLWLARPPPKLLLLWKIITPFMDSREGKILQEVSAVNESTGSHWKH